MYSRVSKEGSSQAGEVEGVNKRGVGYKAFSADTTLMGRLWWGAAQVEFEALTSVLQARTRKAAGAGAGRTGFKSDPE